jgi:hypothetical protein
MRVKTATKASVGCFLAFFRAEMEDQSVRADGGKSCQGHGFNVASALEMLWVEIFDGTRSLDAVAQCLRMVLRDG